MYARDTKMNLIIQTSSFAKSWLLSCTIKLKDVLLLCRRRAEIIY